jgi:hypothetical protein
VADNDRYAAEQIARFEAAVAELAISYALAVDAIRRPCSQALVARVHQARRDAERATSPTSPEAFERLITDARRHLA